MLTPKRIEREVIDAVAQALGADPSRVTRDTRLTDLGVDPWNFELLVLLIELEYGICFPCEPPELHTMEDLLCYVRWLCAEQAPARLHHSRPLLAGDMRARYAP